jgi:glutamyl-Q tRNA(Asp) synthetase
VNPETSRPPAPYRGRFAPSPTGRLHLGSLFAAAASYLQARSHAGEWLLRIEDLDTPRVVPGVAGDFRTTLEQLGFEWDGPVTYQSERSCLYAAALAKLDIAGQVFFCSCSRQELAALPRPAGEPQQSQGNEPAHADDSADEPSDELFYPGLCRKGPLHRDRPYGLRVRVPKGRVTFEDALQGRYSQDVSKAIGDFVIRRRDGLYSYQLAVVVDDADQGITEVVRGCDLLSNTPRQMVLQKALELPTPGYAHVPLLVEPGGAKLAKSRRSLPVAVERPGRVLFEVFKLLQLSPPSEIDGASPREAWAWALAHWKPSNLRGIRQIEAGPETRPEN